MGQTEKIAAQRKVVLEELERNSKGAVFEAVAEVLATEREYRENRYGVKDAIRKTLERLADEYDPGEEVGADETKGD